MVTGRLAPTPSGRLHLGNVCAFAAAWLSARSVGGRLLLRIEDIDTGRARADIQRSIREDLLWLGLAWDAETPCQSSRTYAHALEALTPHTYRCRCTRQQLRQHGGFYPGTCRDAAHHDGALRLRLPEGTVRFTDRRFGPQEVDPNAFGDPVLVRSDGLISYNLAVTVDDEADGVDEVVRGADLLDLTAVQIRLRQALGYRQPTWMHAPLVIGPDGRKLSKSHGSLEVARLRDSGVSPGQICLTVLPWLGIDGVDDLSAAARLFDPARGPLGPIHLDDEAARLLTTAAAPPPR